jgi:DNA (cytosine-5)-methyltransferase 1
MQAAEFFAGIGLVRLALERADWDVVFANDIDPKKREMYASRFGSSEFLLGDIRSLRGTDMPKVDLATASFPCIDLSLAGNRAGLNGKHSSAYWEFLRVITEMQRHKPRFILLENVLGLLSSHNGRDLAEIVRSLNRLGYACDLIAVDASWFVPQSRQRLFVVGRLSMPQGRLPLIAPHPARPKAVVEFVLSHNELIWDLAPLPAVRPKRPQLSKIVESIPNRDPRWWTEDRQAHLYSQMSDLHRQKLKELSFSRTWRFATVYKRVRPTGCKAELRFDDIAGCLRTPRGGSSKQFIIRAGRGAWRVRNMTPREYARLQGVPDRYPIEVPINNALLGFGDAVCVPAVTWVLRNCVNPYLRKGLLIGKAFSAKTA